MDDWPIIEPSQDERKARREGRTEHAAPEWIRITCGRSAAMLRQISDDPSPEMLAKSRAARKAKAKARRLRELKARETRADNSARIAEERRLRAELSASHKLEAAARRAEETRERRVARQAAKTKPVPLSREERGRRIAEGMARARSEGKLLGRGGHWRLAPPEGHTSIAEAASVCGYNRNYLSRKCQLGEIPSIEQGGMRFVRVVDVMAAKAEAAARLAEAQQRNAAKARAARAEKASRRRAEYCPRKRGAA